jgi:hypothetical protein
VFALFGFASALGGLGALITLTSYVFLGVVTVKLWRARPNAMRHAVALILLELAGGTLFLLAADIASGRVELLGAAVTGLGVAVVWFVPNLIALRLFLPRYRPPARVMIEIKRPGDLE